MGAHDHHFPLYIVIRPDYVRQTVKLLRPLPPDDVACYLIVVVSELYATGRLTPSLLARISDLVADAMSQDRAA
jgi:hypothetical protein